MPGEPTDSELVRANPEGRDDWDRHWADYAASAEENPAQEFRRRLVLRLLDGVGAESRVLDIGSGTGDLAAAIHAVHPGTALLGLELSAEGVELSRAKVPTATFMQADLLGSPRVRAEYAGWATHAVCSEVLEHVDDPRELLANALPYLAPGCQLVVTVPGGPMTAYDKYIGHRRHFRPADLAELLRATGFEVQRATGAGFPIFNLYRLLMRALGSRLIDVAGTSSRKSRAAMRLFAVAFRVNGQLSRLGWQLVATARYPGTRRGAGRD